MPNTSQRPSIVRALPSTDTTSHAGSAGGQRRIAIIGSGVVGTATGVGFAAKGRDVVFCDVVRTRLTALRRQGLAAVDPSGLSAEGCDVFLISVPSPTTAGRVDTSYVETAAAIVGRAIATHPGWPLVVVRSTVPPGTTEELVLPTLEAESDRSAGSGFGLCMNPEFLRALSAEEDFRNPRVIVIGALDERSDQELRAVYAAWPHVPVVSVSLRGAELTKYTSNLFNATKISFFNEMEQICNELHVDARDVFAAVARGAEGLWNPEYGTRGLAPYAGACLPKDTVGFLGFARSRGLDDRMLMLQATIETNERLAPVQDVFDASWHEQEQAQAL